MASAFLSDAKAKIQHTNKLSLAPKEIKHLADIISTEKNVLTTSSKLSVDYRKAADALKEWGLNEGEDLGDILPKLTILLGHLADAQSRFSDHDSTYRIHFKSIRTREETLTGLKKAKETVQGKIAGLEKKIAKMSSENKDLPGLTTRLTEARAESVSLENSVSVEEARLSDFKRETVREGLGLRLGAMLELAEKMKIVCESGRMLIDLVPIDRTPPGYARAPYCSANQTQSIVEEAQQSLTHVVFNLQTPSLTNVHHEASSEIQSSLSPNSEQELPATPLQTGEMPLELPPFYFSNTQVENFPQPGGNSPGSKFGLPKPQLPAKDSTFASYHHGPTSRDQPHEENSNYPSHPSSNNGASTISPSPSGLVSRLVTHNNQSDGLAGSPSQLPYTDNAFYVRSSDGVLQSTSSGKPEDSLISPDSVYSPPVSNRSEVSGPPKSYEQVNAYTSGARDYNRSSSGDPQVPSSTGNFRSDSDETNTNHSKSRYSPRVSVHSPVPGVSGLPASEGRTTNAGAFRRNMANQVASPPSSYTRRSEKSLVGTDEPQTKSGPGNTAVLPLQINKRDTLASDPR